VDTSKVWPTVTSSMADFISPWFATSGLSKEYVVGMISFVIELEWSSQTSNSTWAQASAREAKIIGAEECSTGEHGPNSSAMFEIDIGFPSGPEHSKYLVIPADTVKSAAEAFTRVLELEGVGFWELSSYFSFLPNTYKCLQKISDTGCHDHCQISTTSGLHAVKSVD
jgi:hypothetical protein